MVDYTAPLVNMANEILTFLPVVIAAIIILIIGWIVGRIAGSIVHGIFKRAHVDEHVSKTGAGEAIAGTGMTFSGLFAAVVRWFVYLIFILAAVSVLNIPTFSNFINEVLLYIPNLIAGILVLVIGLLALNFIMDWIRGILKSQEVPFANIITTGIQVILSIVVIVIALDQLKIDTQIIYTFLVPLAWGVGAMIAIAGGIAFGVGGKDIVADYLKKLAEAGEAKQGEIKQKAEQAEGQMEKGGGKTGGGETPGPEEEFREPEEPQR